jgi:hypothetical protein
MGAKSQPAGQPASGSLGDFVSAKLIRVMGRERAEGLIQEIMTADGIPALDSPQALLWFANGLMKRGGFAEVVGRSLKVYAILRGAIETPPPQS